MRNEDVFLMDYSLVSDIAPTKQPLRFDALKVLPPEARKKMQGWIRSHHLICSGNYFIFETLDYSAIERYDHYVTALGGTVISINSIGKVWMGNHRQVILYRAKASLHTPHHKLKQYWIKYGSFRTKFAQQI
ncbi:MAG: CpeR family transcriptional regulator [Leptolyngbyaceae cyanobacterium]